MIIAIDGPAASGKGTLAQRIAGHFGYVWLDTGLLYRAVARDVLAAGGDLEDERGGARAAGALDAATLGDPALRSTAIGEAASVVAKHRGVRAALLDFQRNFARTPPGAVLDGRDIATVICPDADVKIFVTADVEVRARRRFEEYVRRGERVSYEEVLDIIRQRDQRDASRSAAPLQQAPDAVLLDTTHMDIEMAFRAALDIISHATSAR
ncbi:MAG TPA: d(CMP) kinase [Hyphomicrobiaceae bacterium]|nr:d(CMP) kinase [Hyphomicrobiaceae bacterium]